METTRRAFLRNAVFGAGAVLTGGLEALAGEAKQKKEDSDSRYRISPQGVDLVKGFEGFRSEPYLCQAGKKTIGYGHVIRSEENYGSVSREDAEKLLKKDIAPVERTINYLVNVNLTQNQYDAVCSFVYNVGIGAFSKSTMLKKINKRDYDGAAEEFGKWKYAGGKESRGLKIRREKEREIFLKR